LFLDDLKESFVIFTGKSLMRTIQNKYPYILFLLITVIVFSLALLLPNYRHYPVEGMRDVLLIGAHWLASVMGMFCILFILSLNRFVFLLLFPVFLIVASLTAVFTWQYDLSINSALIESLIYTNSSEIYSYISLSLVLFIAFSFFLGVIFVVYRFRVKLTLKQGIIAMGAAIVFFSLFWVQNQKRYNTLMVRSPFSYYLAIREFSKEREEVSKERKMLGLGADTEVDSLTVVFVIGEALRADHLQMNGYTRSTMPNMEKRNVVSLPNIFSPFTHTAQSLPYIFTRASQESLKPVTSESSFIDIFKACKFETAWIGNQNPTKAYRFFVAECDTVFINKPQFSDYSNVKKLDSDLIPLFENQVKVSKSKVLFNIHLKGNHWWYNSNYPDTFAYFQPILTGKTISASNKERMINSYDNSTLFSDYVLEKLISSIEHKDAILVFLSDHGQSFGEEGKWLHANNTAAEQNPAGFIWLSDSYIEKYPEKYKILLSNREKHTETAFLFHTILDAALINSTYLNKQLCLFSSEYQAKMENND
jgi:lipid A ethanolaminephosphotransferase